MAKLSQKERILRHLKDFGSITPQEAIADYGVYRLGARIWDLKHDGHLIETQYIGARNRYGEPTHFAKYVYKGEGMNEVFSYIDS